MAELTSVLRDRLGDEKVITDESKVSEKSIDMADYSGSAVALVKAQSEQDVVEVLRIANELRVPVVARGAGSSLTGAVVPHGGIILDMSGLNKVLKVDPINYYVRVQPGITLDDLNNELKKHGFFFPPDPASSYICTVGGAISEGSGGMRCVRYGTMKDWVMSVRAVLGNGALVSLGEPLAKNRAGYDLLHLLVGSEGTLGVITEAHLKIIPLQDRGSRRFLVHFADWESAGAAIVGIRKSRITPSMVEFLDRPTVAAVNKALQLDLKEAEAILIVDVDGDQAEKAREIFASAKAQSVEVAETEEDSEQLFQARAWAYIAIKALSPSVIVEDVVVPIDRLVEYLTFLKEVAAANSTQLPMVGHAGDGNVHPTILYDKGDPESAAKADRIFKQICRKAIELGGSVTGEHGVGVQKVELFKEQLAAHQGTEALRLMKEIKKLFDPNGILNPGKYVEAA